MVNAIESFSRSLKKSSLIKNYPKIMGEVIARTSLVFEIAERKPAQPAPKHILNTLSGIIRINFIIQCSTVGSFAIMMKKRII